MGFTLDYTRKDSPPEKRMMPQDSIEVEGRPRARAALIAFLAASAAVHAAAIVALPTFPLDRPRSPITVLEVVLVQSESPPPVAVADARSKAPPRPLPLADTRPDRPPKPAAAAGRASVKPRSVAKPARKPPPTKAAAPVLTLPETAPAADLVAPAESPDTIAQAEISPPARVAIAAPTPPSFSASYLQNPAPRYPLAARRAGEQGTVTLKILVSSEGLPQRLEVEMTSGSSRLDEAALNAVKRWRFVPARRGATPIESWVLVPVVFRLEDPS